jgi:hypothetical protein
MASLHPDFAKGGRNNRNMSVKLNNLRPQLDPKGDELEFGSAFGFT